MTAAKLCADVPFGGGKMIECLKKHETEITVGCANELKLVKP